MHSSSTARVRRPLPATPESHSASSALRNLSKLVASITTDDINGAKLCGGGGFCDVYELTHPSIGKLALKRVRTSGNQQQVDAQLRRSTREAETWRQLIHPNVLPFLDILERSSGVYLVSPFVQNGSINEFAQQHPDVDRVRLIQDAAAGIAYLHQSGIVHGDIKGANILVSDDIRALLCDFGLARPEEVGTSTDMQGLGTVRWQSPELLISGKGKTFKSDVWAFAMTIVEILSGRLPYHKYETNPAVIVAVMVRKARPSQEPATSPTGVSYAPLWGVAVDCWSEDPDQRPEMQEAHDRLILGGFRSLLLSPSLASNEDVPSNIQAISPSPKRSPSLSLLDIPPVHLPNLDQAVHDEAPIPPFPVEHFAMSSRTARPGPEQTMRVPVSWVRPNDYPTVTSTGSSVAKAGHEQKAKVPVTSNGSNRSRTVSSIGSNDLNDDQVLGGHRGVIGCLAFSPDGTTIASGSRDRTLRFWSVKSGKQKGSTLEGHTGWVNCVSFSPDGTTIMSGSGDSTLRLWDVQSRSRMAEALEGHNAPVRCMRVSPDGRTIASGSVDHTLRFWDVESGNQRSETLGGHTGCINCLSFSPDGNYVASGSDDYTVRLWDVQSGSQMTEALEGHSAPVRCIAFSPDGKTVASGSDDHTLRLWDVESGNPTGKMLRDHTHYVVCLEFSPDGMIIASGSYDNTVRFWDVESGSQIVEALEGHKRSISCLAFSPDGRTVASGAQDNIIRLWDVESGSQRGMALEGHFDHVVCLAFSPDGMTLASGSEDHTLRMWKVHSRD